MSIYYPYFRAKQFEVSAITNLAPQLAQKGSIIPIFEPVTRSSLQIIKCASKFATTHLTVAFILNPRVGAVVNNLQTTEQMFQDMKKQCSDVIPALIVDQHTSIAEINCLNRQMKHKAPLFIHAGNASATIINTLASINGKHIFKDGAVGLSYVKNFQAGSRLLMRDGFKAQRRNRDFPSNSFFDDLHLNYVSLGFAGFGDYATVGDHFSSTGGPAYAVAIHITEDDNNGIVCNHFVSSSNATTANPGGKFGEALDSLINYSRLNPGKIDFSNAYHTFYNFHINQHFPGLGEVKRLSIEHHLELMCRLV